MPLKPGELFLESQLDRRRGRDPGVLPPARLRRGRRQVGGQRSRSAAAGEGLVRAGDRHRRRIAIGGWRDPDHRQPPPSRPTSCVRSSRSIPAIPTSSRALSRRATRWCSSTSIAALPPSSVDGRPDGERTIARGSTSTFTVQEGPQSIVDHILIVGNVHTKPDVILRELQFKPGQPIGLQDQFESRRRLSALGLFRRVQITELTHGSGNEHDVLVTVEEAPATTDWLRRRCRGATRSSVRPDRMGRPRISSSLRRAGSSTSAGGTCSAPTVR